MTTDREEPVAETIVACFERCQNYPRDLAGVQALAKGLEEAADKQGIPMAAIVDRWRLSSPFCPTDFDLMGAACLIRDEAERATTERQTAKERFEASEQRLADLVTRGLLAPACSLCEPGAPYCEYGGHVKHLRYQKMYSGEPYQEKPKGLGDAVDAHFMASSAPRAPLKPITDEDIQRVKVQLARERGQAGA